MKQIEAIIRPERVFKVLKELDKADFPAATMIEVRGRGSQRGVQVGKMHYDELPKELLMLVVEDGEVEKAVEIIMEGARTGNYGDGKIFISEVEEAYTIRSGEDKL